MIGTSGMENKRANLETVHSCQQEKRQAGPHFILWSRREVSYSGAWHRTTSEESGDAGRMTPDELPSFSLEFDATCHITQQAF